MDVTKAVKVMAARGLRRHANLELALELARELMGLPRKIICYIGSRVDSILRNKGIMMACFGWMPFMARVTHLHY